MREVLQTAWELIHISAKGFAELSSKKAAASSFPKSWLFHIASPLGWVAGFGFGALAITIGAFTGMLALILNLGKEDR